MKTDYIYNEAIKDFAELVQVAKSNGYRYVYVFQSTEKVRALFEVVTSESTECIGSWLNLINVFDTRRDFYKFVYSERIDPATILEVATTGNMLDFVVMATNQ